MKHKVIILILLLVSSILSIGLIGSNSCAIKSTDVSSAISSSDTIWVPDNYTTIKAAIDAASDGDVIHVREGIYREHLVVKKSVSLMGENKSTTIIDGNKTGTVVLITADNVRFTGFTVQNSGSSWPDTGIRVFKSCNNIIAGNIVSNNEYGIRVDYSYRNTVFNNTVVSNNNIGISIDFYSCSNDVSNNIVSLNYDIGISVRFYSTNNTISRNTVTLNIREYGAYGIELRDSPNNKVTDNNATANAWNIFLERRCPNSLITNNWVKDGVYGICILSSSNSKVIGNVALNNTIGFHLWDSAGCVISGNTFVNSSLAGLRLPDCIECTLVNNTVKDSFYGISMYHLIPCVGEASDKITGNNTIFHNNFVNNAVQAYLAYKDELGYEPPNKWDNGYPSGGNYWSNYNGTDFYCGPHQDMTGGDGIGDTPYTIDANNTDNYPLMSPAKPVQNLNTCLRYETIQEAMDAPETLNGHTIQVDIGIYYEHLTLNKSVALIGDNRYNTIIDGSGAGNVVYIKTNNVNVSGFTIQKSGPNPTDSGIYVYHSNGSDISHNVIINNQLGIYLHSSGNNTLIDNVASSNLIGIYALFSGYNTLVGNTASSNTYGISFVFSGNNTLVDNIFANNQYNFGVGGGRFVDYDSYVDTTNTVDGKPIYYLTGVTNAVIDAQTNAGTIYLVNSDNITIRDLTLTKNYCGVFFWNTTNSKIENVTTLNNSEGILLAYSGNNTIFHNNFISNTKQVGIVDNSTNTWDNGMEGNYWSNYNGTDTNYDGIGDTPYAIDENNTDNYPLMGMFSDFNVTYEGSRYDVTTICNSTISDFDFGVIYKGGKAISFNVTGEDGTSGFCRICIPTALMNGSFIVLVNGTEVPCTLLPCSNSTHSYLYFTYSHSTQPVVIIPEFASAVILPLLIIITLIMITLGKRGQTHKIKQR